MTVFKSPPTPDQVQTWGGEGGTKCANKAGHTCARGEERGLNHYLLVKCCIFYSKVWKSQLYKTHNYIKGLEKIAQTQVMPEQLFVQNSLTDFSTTKILINTAKNLENLRSL